MIRPAIVGAEVWRQVMSAADFRCQCEGACGRAHAPAGQRLPGLQFQCPRRAVPGQPPFVAAPVDPTVPAVVTAGLPVEELRAWCPSCYSGAVTVARRAARSEPQSTEDLFDPAPYRRPARRSGQYRGGDAA